MTVPYLQWPSAPPPHMEPPIRNMGHMMSWQCGTCNMCSNAQPCPPLYMASSRYTQLVSAHIKYRIAHGNQAPHSTVDPAPNSNSNTLLSTTLESLTRTWAVQYSAGPTQKPQYLHMFTMQDMAALHNTAALHVPHCVTWLRHMATRPGVRPYEHGLLTASAHETLLTLAKARHASHA